jgi:hypothetical protein
MSLNQDYEYLEEVYNVHVAIDLCNYFDSHVIRDYVEWLKVQRDGEDEGDEEDEAKDED